MVQKDVKYGKDLLLTLRSIIEERRKNLAKGKLDINLWECMKNHRKLIAVSREHRIFFCDFLC